MRLIHPYRDYIISQNFGQNLNSWYKDHGLLGHNGIDFVSKKAVNERKGEYINCPCDGVVSQVINKGNPDLMQYRGVCILADDENGYTWEVQIGHFTDIFVEEGDKVSAGQIIGREGNTGITYSGGVSDNLKDKEFGNGIHCHFQTRKCQKTVNALEAIEYLSADGVKPLQVDGYFYKVCDFKNGYNGCEDPAQFLSYMTKRDFLNLILNAAIKVIQELLKKLTK